MGNSNDPLVDDLQRIGPEVLGYLARILRNTAEAEDIWQETQVVAIGKRDQLRDQAAFRSWVYSIAYRLALQAMKKRRQGAGEDALEGMAAPGPREPTAQAVKTENKRTLREIIDELPEPERTLVVLHHARDLSWDEIAAIVKTTRTGKPMTGDNAKKRYERLKPLLQRAFEERRVVVVPEDQEEEET